MLKICCYVLLFAFCSLCFGQEYLKTLDEGIHSTFVTSSWCGNLSVSTQMGKLTKEGRCHYLMETGSSGFDYCGPFFLNGFLLEKNAGSGFNCAATRIHSNVTGQESIDEYKLILDEQGHYINTSPATGHVVLR